MERYKAKRHKNPLKAIREMCIEFMGGRGSHQNYSKLIANADRPIVLYTSSGSVKVPTRKPKLLRRNINRLYLMEGRTKLVLQPFLYE